MSRIGVHKSSEIAGTNWKKKKKKKKRKTTGRMGKAGHGRRGSQTRPMEWQRG